MARQAATGASPTDGRALPPDHPMEIYIFRDGSQSGPFSEETIRRLLQEQSVTPGDLAWQPGAAQWIPLQEVLATPAKEERSPASAAPAPIPVAGTTPVS